MALPVLADSGRRDGHARGRCARGALGHASRLRRARAGNVRRIDGDARPQRVELGAALVLLLAFVAIGSTLLAPGI